MKVFVSPDNLYQSEHQSIVTALLRSKRFLIVDRSAGLNAGEREKDFQDTPEVGYRLAKRQKLEGSGGVIVATRECDRKIGWSEVYLTCSMVLSLYDVSSARLIYAYEGEYEGRSPTWKKVAAEFAEDIPTGIVDEEIPIHLQEDIAEAAAEAAEAKKSASE